MMWILLLISFTSLKDVVLFIYQFHQFEARLVCNFWCLFDFSTYLMFNNFYCQIMNNF
jgi:hypothetical protein